MTRRLHPSVTLRRLLPDDWRLLREARLQALGDTPEWFDSTFGREATFDEDTWRQRCATTVQLVAVTEDGAPGGTGGMARLDSDPSGCELMGLWVAPELRSLGVAARLVHEMLDVARRSGAEHVTLWVAPRNTSARTLYQRSGFRVTGERETFPDRPGVELLRMRRPLP